MNKEHFENERNPTVTCIIPTKNRAGFLSKALDSILSQTYKSIEIIVVNDNSTDNTRAVLADYAATDSRIKVIHNDISIGGAPSRDLAIQIARGKYTAFLDDDDEWLPSKIEKQIKYAESYSVVSCYLSSRSKRRFCEHVTYRPKIVSLRDIIWEYGSFAPSSIMAKTDYLREINGFDSELTGSRGLDLCIRLIKEFGEAFVVGELLTIIDDTPGIPKDGSGKKHIDGCFACFEKHKDIMDEPTQKYRLAKIYFRKLRKSDVKLSDKIRSVNNFLRYECCNGFRFSRKYLKHKVKLGVSFFLN